MMTVTLAVLSTVYSQLPPGWPKPVASGWHGGEFALFEPTCLRIVLRSREKLAYTLASSYLIETRKETSRNTQPTYTNLTSLIILPNWCLLPSNVSAPTRWTIATTWQPSLPCWGSPWDPSIKMHNSKQFHPRLKSHVKSCTVNLIPWIFFHSFRTPQLLLIFVT